MVNLEGAKIIVEVMIHKATKSKEIERATVVKKVLGPIVTAYVPVSKQNSSEAVLLVSPR